MDIHPLVVHFPIVCLVLYSLLEIISVFKPSWKAKLQFTKIFLLVIGVVGAFMAVQTGEIARDLIGKTNVIEAHETYADLAYKLYAIILFLYIITWEQVVVRVKNNLIIKIVSFIDKMHKYGIVAILSIIALVFLTITGALGAAISHGPDTDPVVKFVYDLIIN